MNNRYLFKAKRIDWKEWEEEYQWFRGNLINVGERCYLAQCRNNSNELWIREWIEVDPSTICQCTGLKDQNGTLIWENDMVRYCDCTEERYVIAWEENKACFEYQQYGCSIMNFDELSGIGVEVIGSYIDNPELLEVEL